MVAPGVASEIVTDCAEGYVPAAGEKAGVETEGSEELMV
jgi:hypothetical protein